MAVEEKGKGPHSTITTIVNVLEHEAILVTRGGISAGGSNRECHGGDTADK